MPGFGGGLGRTQYRRDGSSGTVHDKLNVVATYNRIPRTRTQNISIAQNQDSLSRPLALDRLDLNVAQMIEKPRSSVLIVVKNNSLKVGNINGFDKRTTTGLFTSSLPRREANEKVFRIRSVAQRKRLGQATSHWIAESHCKLDVYEKGLLRFKPYPSFVGTCDECKGKSKNGEHQNLQRP